MYRIIKAEDKKGNDKLNNIASIHSLEGTFFAFPEIGSCIYFAYNDKSGQMMASTPIVDIKKVDGKIQIETINSTYWFEKVEE